MKSRAQVMTATNVMKTPVALASQGDLQVSSHPPIVIGCPVRDCAVRSPCLGQVLRDTAEGIELRCPPLPLVQSQQLTNCSCETNDENHQRPKANEFD